MLAGGLGDHPDTRGGEVKLVGWTGLFIFTDYLINKYELQSGLLYYLEMDRKIESSFFKRTVGSTVEEIMK